MKKWILPLSVIFGIFLLLASYQFGYHQAKKNWNINLSEPLDTIYAVYNEKVIRASDIEPQIRQSLLDLKRSEYALKKQAVVSFIKSQGIDALMANPNQTESDEKEFQKYLKERNIDFKKINEQAKKDIQNMFQIHISRLRESQNLTQNIQWQIPIRYKKKQTVEGQSFVKSLIKPKAPIQVVLFTNFYCVFCDSIFEKINLLQEKFKEKYSLQIRFTMEEDEGSILFTTAMGVGCADEQNKLSEYLQIFQKNKPEDLAKLMELIKLTSLDAAALQKCIESKKHRSDVVADIAEAKRLKISPRPTFFVNGYELPAQDSLEEFQSLLFQK